MTKVLIAEDERPIARLLEMNLTRAGYVCTLAPDGLTAADLIEKNDYDLALLDIMLPGLDGYALLDYLRPQGVPVIFLTAKAAVKDRVLGLRLGADDYIVKPFAMDELMARMEMVLRRAGKGGHQLQAFDVTLDSAVAAARLALHQQPAALWQGEELVSSNIPVDVNAPLADGTMTTVRSGGGTYALFASELQGGYRIVTAYDLTALYTSRNAAVRRFLGLEAVVLAAAALVTALLARQMTRPLQILRAASAEIAGGDYDRRTALHTGDELENVSQSFDKMADAVQEKIADLQVDVQRREDFMGAFAHELKTPMTSIIGYADMLRTLQIDPAEQHEAAGAIYHESRRLEALSYKLLSLLSLSDERLELAPVDLTDLWPRLRMACPQVPLLTPQGGAVVHGDADLLLDLLCNLVQNAAKASPAGMPVTVLLADAGDTVALTVQDHGCGIPADKLARVTEPFYMVDKSRARKQGGSGMGLALCQRIAAVHGGTLQISSQVGVGTAVTVTLPKEVQP